MGLVDLITLKKELCCLEVTVRGIMKDVITRKYLISIVVSSALASFNCNSCYAQSTRSSGPMIGIGQKIEDPNVDVADPGEIVGDSFQRPVHPTTRDKGCVTSDQYRRITVTCGAGSYP